MQSAWRRFPNMTKKIRPRHVPDSLHRELRARAALEGMSLSDYLISEARRWAERPSLTELRQRLAGRSRVVPRESPADAVRAEREGR